MYPTNFPVPPRVGGCTGQTPAVSTGLSTVETADTVQTIGKDKLEQLNVIDTEQESHCVGANALASKT